MIIKFIKNRVEKRVDEIIDVMKSNGSLNAIIISRLDNMIEKRIDYIEKELQKKDSIIRGISGIFVREHIKDIYKDHDLIKKIVEEINNLQIKKG